MIFQKQENLTNIDDDNKKKNKIKIKFRKLNVHFNSYMNKE